ncbi:hypothetical protein NLJ89_g1364 [Agrocybe chaxingu]|uniref:Uncharacterized protein n=1 Tax=Agrocybe chaxingu TaxID=84603 RepID=A0A9W8N052_9AGAR|nr:hypothetical protein NLJ89_g1364 [Agrocybe chaxingu]
MKWWYPGKTKYPIGGVLTLRSDRMAEVEQSAHTIGGHHTARFFLEVDHPTGDRNFITPYYQFQPTVYKPPVFPPRARGILYYHQPSPEEPVMSGQLRFRLCDGYETFDQGTDMHGRNGIDTWHISLYAIVKSFYLRSVVDMLLQEGLVEREVIDKVAKLPIVRTRAPILYSFDTPFVTEMSRPSLRLALVNPDMFTIINIPYVFQHYLPPETPYKGRIRARFEVSTSSEHEIVPTLVLRILEHIDAVECLIPNYKHFMAEPTPGTLLSKRVSILHEDAKHGPWSYPLYSRPHSDRFRKFIGLP